MGLLLPLLPGLPQLPLPRLQKIVVVCEYLLERVRHAYGRGGEGVGAAVHVQLGVLGEGEVGGRVQAPLVMGLALVAHVDVVVVVGAPAVAADAVVGNRRLHRAVVVAVREFIRGGDEGRRRKRRRRWLVRGFPRPIPAPAGHDRRPGATAPAGVRSRPRSPPVRARGAGSAPHRRLRPTSPPPHHRDDVDPAGNAAAGATVAVRGPPFSPPPFPTPPQSASAAAGRGRGRVDGFPIGPDLLRRRRFRRRRQGTGGGGGGGHGDDGAPVPVGDPPRRVVVVVVVRAVGVGGEGDAATGVGRGRRAARFHILDCQTPWIVLRSGDGVWVQSLSPIFRQMEIPRLLSRGRDGHDDINIIDTREKSSRIRQSEQLLISHNSVSKMCVRSGTPCRFEVFRNWYSFTIHTGIVCERANQDLKYIIV